MAYPGILQRLLNHIADMAAHGATAAATAGRMVLRDAQGRAKIADPSAAEDIATKKYVDAHKSSVSVSLTGDVSGSGSIDGSGNVSIATTISGGVTPLPKTGSGVGQWRLVEVSEGVVTLPSNGTWAYVGVRAPFSSSIGADNVSVVAGVDAGGTKIINATQSGYTLHGGAMAWRIA